MAEDTNDCRKIGEAELMKRIVGLILMTSLGLLTTAQAKPTWVKKAQAAGFSEVTSCLVCHTKKEGKVLNDRGHFLADKMKEAGVKEVDFNWLKEYKEPEPTETPIPAPEES